jgi:hypothetical protein
VDFYDPAVALVALYMLSHYLILISGFCIFVSIKIVTAMETKVRHLLSNLLLAIVLIAIGLGFILLSHGQLTGVIFGFMFFLMAITAIVDQNDLIKFGST